MIIVFYKILTVFLKFPDRDIKNLVGHLILI